MKSRKAILIGAGILLVLLVLLALFCGSRLYAMFAIADLPCAMSAEDTRIADAYMSRDSRGADRTTVFTPTDKVLHVSLNLRCPFAGTRIRGALIAVDVEGADQNQLLIEASTIITSEEVTGRDLQKGVQFANSMLWPPGQYRVDIYFNDQLKTSIDFRVQ